MNVCSFVRNLMWLWCVCVCAINVFDEMKPNLNLELKCHEKKKHTQKEPRKSTILQNNQNKRSIVVWTQMWLVPFNVSIFRWNLFIFVVFAVVAVVAVVIVIFRHFYRFEFRFIGIRLESICSMLWRFFGNVTIPASLVSNISNAWPIVLYSFDAPQLKMH